MWSAYLLVAALGLAQTPSGQLRLTNDRFANGVVGMTRDTKLHLSELYDMKQKGQYRVSVERLFYTPDAREVTASTNIVTITVGEPKTPPK